MTTRTLAARVAALTLPFTLLACTAEEPEIREASVRPVKTLLLEDAVGLSRSFPASIEASRRVEMSFRVPGMLNTLQVQEGDEIGAGQVLATLDPTDYQLALQEAEAEYDRALNDYERAQLLVVDGHLSRTDFDLYESEFRAARANREQATLDLSYTELRAPISGTVARRYIQNFEEVAAKQEVFSLRDNSEMEVRVNIPQQVMTLLALEEDPDIEGVYVTFPTAGNEQFPLSPKEIATQADPATQTFEARFTFEAPSHLNILPGMSAVFIADMDLMHTEALTLTLPETAIDRRGEAPQLWIYHPENGKASPVPVEIGPVIGGEVELIDGVGFGQRIIIAGADQLDESMELYEMLKVEQAN